MTAEKHKNQHTYKQKELPMKCQQFFLLVCINLYIKNPRCGKAKRSAGAKIS